jgi:hypothetical protein
VTPPKHQRYALLESLNRVWRTATFTTQPNSPRPCTWTGTRISRVQGNHEGGRQRAQNQVSDSCQGASTTPSRCTSTMRAWECEAGSWHSGNVVRQVGDRGTMDRHGWPHTPGFPKQNPVGNEGPLCHIFGDNPCPLPRDHSSYIPTRARGPLGVPSLLATARSAPKRGLGPFDDEPEIL